MDYVINNEVGIFSSNGKSNNMFPLSEGEWIRFNRWAENERGREYRSYETTI